MEAVSKLSSSEWITLAERMAFLEGVDMNTKVLVDDVYKDGFGRNTPLVYRRDRKYLLLCIAPVFSCLL